MTELKAKLDAVVEDLATRHPNVIWRQRKGFDWFFVKSQPRSSEGKAMGMTGYDVERFTVPELIIQVEQGWREND